ncbi:MAG: hypothetical protein HY895_18490 [Deltaproteobacteria bacterium]|nr:hypothetical protein [Deltaproteobacteria bacterium]
MYRIEVVQVRLFDVRDGELVIDAFNRIPRKPPPFRAAIYQSAKVTNDWSICFWKSNADDIELKSPEAICLGESLRSIGFVDHSLWLPVPTDQDGGQDQFGFENAARRRKRPSSGKTCS